MYLMYMLLLIHNNTGAPNPDKNGNYVECHMFVPYGGIGKPRRNDRVFITLSPDGRVHEPPIIQ